MEVIKNMSIEILAKQNFLSQFPEIKFETFGFRKNTKKWIQKELEKEDAQEVISVLPHRVPDLYAIHNNCLLIIEIEDTNPLSKDKLLEYGEFCDALDFYDMEMELYSVNRYGGNPYKIPLFQIFYCDLVNSRK